LFERRIEVTTLDLPSQAEVATPPRTLARVTKHFPHRNERISPYRGSIRFPFPHDRNRSEIWENGFDSPTEALKRFLSSHSPGHKSQSTFHHAKEVSMVESTKCLSPHLACRLATWLRFTNSTKPRAVWVLCLICAGWENRTPNHSLENCYFTIKLIPHCLDVSLTVLENCYFTSSTLIHL
jgi:hypothetical protein